MKQEKYCVFGLLLSLMFLVGTAIGSGEYPVFSGSTDDDLYFNGVIFDDIQIPEDLSVSPIESTVEVKGTGSITIGDQKKGILPRALIFGGTEIKSFRVFEETDVVLPWEGVFTVPDMMAISDVGEIVFAEEGKHDKSQTTAVKAFRMGLEDETFSFDPPIIVSLPIDEPEGKKILLAFNDEANDTDEEEWSIEEGMFCIIQNGACTFELEEMNAVALVRELYSTCPRTVLAHGEISRVPECLITCDAGYELNELANDCVEAVGGDSDDGFPVLEEDYGKEYEELGTAWRKGYIRYRPSRDQLNYVDGNRSRPISDQLVEENQEVAEEDTGGFFNYLLAMRNRFGENSSPNIKESSEEIINVENFEETQQNEESDSLSEEFKSTAPLLPSSGPGIFISIAAIGMGMMVFGVRKK
jgi:hypothetical protein